MYKLGINFDEVSDDINVALKFMADNELARGELRTVNKKNFVYWSDNEARQFQLLFQGKGIELIAAATPLFKWYLNSDDREITHDNFGFDPRLSDDAKRRIIKRTMELSQLLQIPRLRIFSGLGRTEHAGEKFANDSLLAYALEIADKHNVDLYLENEPVCHVHTTEDIVALFTNNKHPRLKLWLDIANLIEIGEEVTKYLLTAIGPRLGYLHVKDYVLNEAGERQYVPAGQGVIDYRSILDLIALHVPQDLALTIETHAPKILKLQYSQQSLTNIRNLVKELGM